MKPQHFFCYLAVIAVCFTACKKDKEVTGVTITDVTGVTLNDKELLLAPNDTITLIATVQPDDATNKNISWTSSNPAVATVSDNGLVTAIADGNATITATTKDGSKTATCSINVDYRNNWVGIYEFTTIDHLHYCEDPMCSTGVFDIRDTIQFIGTIEIFGTNRLRIVFKPNATEPKPSHWLLQINGIIYPTVDPEGILTYSEYNSGESGFLGSLSGNEINMNYGASGPLGMQMYEDHAIHGIKSNKK